MPKKKWNAERDALLTTLWGNGAHVLTIAATLGGFENCKKGGSSAIYGRVHTLGLPVRKQGGYRSAPKVGKRKAKSKMHHAVAARAQTPGHILFADAESYVPPAEELVIPLKERKYVVTLEAVDCRWPIGDPQNADFHFCGKKKTFRPPYCEFHMRRAYQPLGPRRTVVVKPVY